MPCLMGRPVRAGMIYYGNIMIHPGEKGSDQGYTV